MVFASPSLSDAENTLLADDVVFIHPHTVKGPFDDVFDFLYVQTSVRLVARPNPEHLSFHSHIGLESLLQILG
jgi:hypothetical protein